MSVTWEQLTEAQRGYLADACAAKTWRRPNFRFNGMRMREYNDMETLGLIEMRGYPDDAQLWEERATAAGLEVYAQRNAAPASSTTQVEYTIDSFEMADDIPDIRIDNQTGYSIIVTVDVADGEVVITLVRNDEKTHETHAVNAPGLVSEKRDSVR